MPLSWNEIRHRAVASFGMPVKKLTGNWGFINALHRIQEW
jgi:hypothetical protein